MHLGGLLSREAPQVKVVHIAEIMAGTSGEVLGG
jgi:hypothetical protein